MKRIALTPEEKNTIKLLSVEEGWTDDKIAARLGRSKEVVQKWRKRFGIKKGSNGVPRLNSQVKLDKNNINKSNISEENKHKLWMEYFKTTTRYKRLKKQLSDDDLETFTEMMAQYYTQFDDLKASEEEQLEILVTTKLRLDDNRKAYREAQQKEEELKNMAGGKDKELNLENEKDRFIYEMIITNNNLLQGLTKIYLELLPKYETYFRALNSTREQRELKEKIGGDTFISLVKQLTEQDKREEVGLYNELMKKATNEKLRNLKKPYKFSDTDIAPIVMEGKDYKVQKDEKNGK